MPRIERGGRGALYEIDDCPICNRTVYLESETGLGFIAPCGRRVVNLSECGLGGAACRDHEQTDYDRIAVHASFEGGVEKHVDRLGEIVKRIDGDEQGMQETKP